MKKRENSESRKNRYQKLVRGFVSTLTDYFYSKGATHLKTDAEHNDREIQLSVYSDVNLNKDQLEELIYYLDQPSVHENEFYYYELLGENSPQQLRLLGSLIDDFTFQTNKDGTYIHLCKNALMEDEDMEEDK